MKKLKEVRLALRNGKARAESRLRGGHADDDRPGTTTDERSQSGNNETDRIAGAAQITGPSSQYLEAGPAIHNPTEEQAPAVEQAPSPTTDVTQPSATLHATLPVQDVPSDQILVPEISLDQDASSSVQVSLWDEAYRNMRSEDPRLLDAFEKSLLSFQSADPTENESGSRKTGQALGQQTSLPPWRQRDRGSRPVEEGGQDRSNF